MTPSGASAARALGREHELLAELEARLPPAAAFSQQFSPAVRDAVPFYWAGYRLEVRYTYRLEDLGSADALWNDLRGNIRREIRDPQGAQTRGRRPRPGRRCYTVSATDPAGNAATVTVTARTGSRLRAPAPGTRLQNPPLLRWRNVPTPAVPQRPALPRHAKGPHTWPVRARLRLHRAWRYGGVHRRLAPGVYRWFVWPGFGRRSAHRYGSLIGTRRFVVVGRPPARSRAEGTPR